MENYKQEMGVRLRQKRKELFMTQEQMADQLNISIKHYSEVERGITGLSVENIIKISSLLHTSIDYLLTGNGKREEFPQKILAFYDGCTEEKKRYMAQLLDALVQFVEG